VCRNGRVLPASYLKERRTLEIMKMTSLWDYSSFSQPLYQCYDCHSHAHHHPHPHRYQTPDAMTPVFNFKSSQPYCRLNYASRSQSVSVDSVRGAWKSLRPVASERQWTAAVTGHAVGRATNITAAIQHPCSWTPYPGIGG